MESYRIPDGDNRSIRFIFSDKQEVAKETANEYNENIQEEEQKYMKHETYEKLKQHKKELEAKVITQSPVDLLREAVLTLIDALVEE